MFFDYTQCPLFIQCPTYVTHKHSFHRKNSNLDSFTPVLVSVRTTSVPNNPGKTNRGVTCDYERNGTLMPLGHGP